MKKNTTAILLRITPLQRRAIDEMAQSFGLSTPAFARQLFACALADASHFAAYLKQKRENGGGL